MCKTYYVNPLTGKDENDGLHEDRAFATLFAVNRLALAPGDTVLPKAAAAQFFCSVAAASYGCHSTTKGSRLALQAGFLLL